MKFVQHIRFKTDDIEAVMKAADQADRTTMLGNPQSWVLADRDTPGSYVVSVVFDSADEAMKNDDLPQTQAFAATMAQLTRDVSWGNYDLIREE